MRTLTLTAALVALLTFGGTATAGAPLIERSTVHRHVDDFYVCAGFDVAGDFDIRRTAMEFPDRLVIHREIEGTLTSSKTGATLPVREHDVITFYADGSVRITGEALHVVVPGAGTVLLIAGRSEFDAEGNATFHGRNDEALVCAALG